MLHATCRVRPLANMDKSSPAEHVRFYNTFAVTITTVENVEGPVERFRVLGFECRECAAKVRPTLGFWV